MKQLLNFCLFFCTVSAGVLFGELDYRQLEQTTGFQGKYDTKEEVYEVMMPRSDARVSINNSQLPPFLGLMNEISFKQGRGDDVMVMAEMGLMQEEINPLIDAALKENFRVEALHTHFLFDQPKVYFVHLTAMGPIQQVGPAIRRIMDSPRQARSMRPEERGMSLRIPGQSSLTPDMIGNITGHRLKEENGMIKVVAGRTVRSPAGEEMDGRMGIKNDINFAGTQDQAVALGFFVVRPNELRATLGMLRQANFNISAIVNHTLGEEPRMIFVHFAGQGRAQDLAMTVRQALELQRD